jgi:hypothetical protein
MTRNRERIHVISRESVVPRQVLRVVQMPPDIRVGNPAAREPEHKAEDDQEQDRSKRKKRPSYSGHTLRGRGNVQP